MTPEEHPTSPSLPWRTTSMLVMGVTGLVTRGFLYGLSSTRAQGLDGFLKLLDERSDVAGRGRGLITVSNHVSVLDDPMIWGVLPFRYQWTPDNLRWSLGSYDICFKNKFQSIFFTFGQVLPTHRLRHSPHGGPFQPTITQAIRLLSAGPFPSASPSPGPAPGSPSISVPDLSDPFANAHLTYAHLIYTINGTDISLSTPDLSDPFTNAYPTYTTNGTDVFPTPSAYASHRHAWVHIFPEGKVHQKQDKTMRYFKWGVARLILESDPCPDIVPMWIDGPQEVMHEARQWPRFVPRPGKAISVCFGEKLDGEAVFGGLRERWRRLKAEEMEREGLQELEVGVLTEGLKNGEEAVSLRKQCTMMVREEVLKVRRRSGLPDEDPKASSVETWREEGGKKEGRMDDGSWVKDM